jgi:hypothetical protein
VGLYQKIMQCANYVGLRKPIQEGQYKELLTAHKAGDVVVGDLLNLDGRELMYYGMNKKGGPGESFYARMGNPSPCFWPSKPEPKTTYHYFSQTSFPNWKKVGHRSPEEWNAMVEEINKELIAQEK